MKVTFEGLVFHSFFYTSITVNYKQIYLGTFRSLEYAIEARKAAELKYFKEHSTIVSRGKQL